MTEESKEGAVRENTDGGKRVHILLALEPLSHGDFLGCLQPAHLLGLVSQCRMSPGSLPLLGPCHRVLGWWLCEKPEVMALPFSSLPTSHC